MNEKTAWYLGIRGEKVAYQPGWGSPYAQYMPQQFQERPWWKSEPAMIAGGTALGLGSMGLGYGARKTLERAEELERFGETGEVGSLLKRTDELDPGYLEKIKKMKASPDMADLTKHRDFVQTAGKWGRRAGLAGLLGGAGLAGYGAYKAFQD